MDRLVEAANLYAKVTRDWQRAMDNLGRAKKDRDNLTKKADVLFALMKEAEAALLWEAEHLEFEKN